MLGILRNRLTWLAYVFRHRPDDLVVAILCSLTGLPVAALAMPLAVSMLMTATSHEWVLFAFALTGITGLSVYLAIRPWQMLAEDVSRDTRRGAHNGG